MYFVPVYVLLKELKGVRVEEQVVEVESKATEPEKQTTITNKQIQSNFEEPASKPVTKNLKTGVIEIFLRNQEPGS